MANELGSKFTAGASGVMFYFHSLSAFLNMGGYAPYVWTTYAIVAALLVWPMFNAKRKMRMTLTKLNQKYEHKA